MPKRRLMGEKKAWRHNRARATLLKLPHEIRNRIYALVVGGDTVHVSVNENGKIHTNLCKAPEADAHAVRTICNVTKPMEVVHYTGRHISFAPPRVWGSKRPIWYSDILDFFRAHKRFYKDAKALPFMLNTFVFADSDTFAKFKKVLHPFQRDNLVSIVINCFDLPYLTKTPTPTYPMPELKNLTIFYEVAPNDNSKLAIHIYVESIRKQMGKLLLEEFHGGKIKNVEVCITTRSWEELGRVDC